MVQDLQVGFTAAMTELSNIQDEDKKLYDKLSDSKQEQEVQMRDVLQLVQTLKVCTCFPLALKIFLLAVSIKRD